MKKTDLLRYISHSTDNWLLAGTGVSGIHYQIIIKKDSAAIHLLISKDKTGELKKKFLIFFMKKKKRLKVYLEAKLSGEEWITTYPVEFIMTYMSVS